MDLEHVGVKSQALQPGKLLQVDVDGKIEPAFIDGALLQPAGHIAKAFTDIGRRELDAVFLEWVRQQAEGGFLDGTFPGVGVGRLLVVGFFVLLCHSHAGGGDNQDDSKKPAYFHGGLNIDDGDRFSPWPMHHTIQARPTQRAKEEPQF